MDNKNFKSLNVEFTKIQNFYQVQNYEEVINRSIVLIRKYPEALPIYNALALAYLQKKEYNFAQKILEKALKINSKDANVLCNLGLVSKAQKNNLLAEDYYKKAIRYNPNHFIALLNYANLKNDLYDTSSSLKLYLKALKLKPDLAEIHLNLAKIYNSIGNFESCKRHCLFLIDKFPEHTVADQMLAEIIDYNVDQSHQELMLKKLSNKMINNSNLIILNFSIAKTYENQKQFDKSIFYLDIANNLKKKLNRNYNINNDVIFFSNVMKKFNPINQDLIEPISDDKFIFIVGLPRSGTTLLHQILSKNPSVRGVGELSFFDRPIMNFIKKTNTSFDYSDDLKFIKLDFLAKIKEFGFKQDIIVEKTPHNFIWIGFLKQMFPNSKIIHSERDIKDTAFSNYKHLFLGNNYSWTYNKDDLTKYIYEYLKIMDFWSNEFGTEIFHNNYYDLITNPVEQTKKIFDYCELEWNSEFLNIVSSKAKIDTLSFVQARRPINKSAIDFYKNYENLSDLFDKIDNSIK